MLAISDPVLIAIVTTVPLVTAGLGAIALAALTGKQRKDERQQDHDWQEDTIVKLDKVAASQEVTHAFLNSAETASMERERVLVDSQRISLGLSLRLLRRLQQGDAPTDEADEVEATKIEEQIKILNKRTEVLQADIDRRLAAQQAVEAEVGVQ